MNWNWKHSALVIIFSELLFWTIGFVAQTYLNANAQEFRWENKEFLGMLILARVLFIVFFLATWGKLKRRQKMTRGLSESKWLKPFSLRNHTYKFLALFYAISLFVMAWGNPQFGKDEKKMNSSGIDIMVCLDVSNSMLARDLSGKMTRLEVAKLAIKNMLKQLKGDRVGVVVFAGSSYSFIPITNDYNYIKLELLSINPGMLSTQGTAIGSAVETAMNSFAVDKTNKAIIIFTDGENHEDNAIKAVKSAQQKGVKIYTVGMGTNKAVPIPKSENGTDYHKDRQGNIVLTKLNEKMMRDVAKAGRGTYVKANKTRVDTKSILLDIDKLEETTFKERKFMTYEDRFQWVLGLGIVLLMLHGLIGRVIG